MKIIRPMKIFFLDIEKKVRVRGGLKLIINYATGGVVVFFPGVAGGAIVDAVPLPNSD